MSTLENQSRFSDLENKPNSAVTAEERTTAAATTPLLSPSSPPPPQVRLQNMFQISEEKLETVDISTTTTTTSTEKLGQQQSSLNNFIPKQKVQFPIELEHRFYHLDPKPPMEEDLPPKPPPSRKERIVTYLQLKFPSRIIRRVLKCTIAYFLTALLSLIHPISQAIGPGVNLSVSGMLFSHPGRSMGAQFDATVTAVLGVLFAVLYAFAGLGCSVAYNVTHLDTYITQPNGRIINGLFLFVGIFAAQLLRQLLPKFHFFSLQFMIIQIFTMTRGIDYLEVPFNLPMNYAIPLLIGHAISLVVNLVCWPETAVDGLGRALKETITSSRDMLHMITNQFFLDPHSEPVPESVIEEAAEKMRKGMTKVKTAYREAKYEMSYAFIQPQQLGQVRKSLGRLTKHLSILGGCIESERELFESAIEALQSEVTDLDSDEESQGRSGYHSDTDEVPRPSYSEEDLNLLRTALRATNEHISGSKYGGGSRQPSANASPRTSRPPSRVNSRPVSVYNSEDEDLAEQNQKSINSLKSFLNLPKLSIPTKLPKKTKKQTEYHHRHLLMTYLESLRDPLMELSLECSNALECVCESIISEMEMDDDISLGRTWNSLLRHTLKIGKKPVVSNQKAQERHKGDKCNCSQNIRLAILEFDRAERERMHALYELNKARLGHDALDLGMRQELFLVFFFIFTMREVANELQEMTLRMDELRLYSRKASFKGKKRKHFYWPVFDTKRWRKWAKGNNLQSVRDKGGYTLSALNTNIPKNEEKVTEPGEEYKLNELQTVNSLKRTKSRKETKEAKAILADEANSPTMLRQRRPIFPKTAVDSNDEKTRDVRIQVPAYYLETEDNPDSVPKLPLFLRIRYAVWLKCQFFSTYDFKFALKMALCVLVLCIPALVPASIGWYTSSRGQWAPMTVIAIMNPTSGGTLEASFWRVVGTLVGAFAGWGALAAGDNSPYLLALFAVLLAIPFFYIHLASTYNKVGIVCLTTYMVVALSQYANPIPGETVESTVWKRTLTLIVGIGAALLLNSLIWPFVARHMVRKSIATCMGHLEDYYTYVMGTFLYHDPEGQPTDAEITRGEKLESKINAAIDACSVLLELTDNEPRFRGPFPKLLYKEMIVSMRNLLDRMLSTRIALLKMPIVVKQDICAKDYHNDRKDMIASMLLTFHTLAASLRSNTPLPVYMPSIRAARIKLMNSRREGAEKTNWIKFRNLTWFAMACSSEEIVEELEYVTDLIRYIVGETEYADRAKRIDNFVCSK